MSIFVTMYCDGCASAKVEIPWPDKVRPVMAIENAAILNGWQPPVLRYEQDEETGRHKAVHYPPVGMHLCPACAAVVAPAEVESVPLFGGERT